MRMLIQALIISCTLSPFALYAQTYWGHIHHYPVRFDLNISEDGIIKGSCRYLKFPSGLPLEGKINPDKTFVLYEVVDHKKNATIRGQQKGDQLIGTWENEQKKLSFLVKNESSHYRLNRYFQEPYLDHGTSRELELADSLYSEYWNKNAFEEEEEIAALDKQLIEHLKSLLQKEETAGYDWEYLLEIRTLRSSDHQLCILTWDENQMGTFRSQKCLIQYRNHIGKLRVKQHDSGFAYNEIYQMPGKEDPVYLLLGAARTCSSCLSDLAELVRIGPKGLETDFGGFQFTRWDYEANQSKLSFQGHFSTYYRYEDFVDFSYDPKMMELHYAFIQNSHDLYYGDLTQKSADEEAFDILIEGTLQYQGTIFREVLYNEQKLSAGEARQLRE
jgi:hypothetical protein